MSDVEVIVLRDDVGLSEVLAVAKRERWILRGETSRAHLVLASRRWEARGGVEISHVVDHPGGAHWLTVEGPLAADVAGRVRGQLAHHSEDELLAAVLDGDAPDAVACIRAASKLAAVRPAAMEPRHLAALERLLGHASVAVRRAGIRSAYGCGWPQLRGIVRRRLGQETALVQQLRHLEQYLHAETAAG